MSSLDSWLILCQNQPVHATTLPDGHGDVNDSPLSLPPVTQDSEDEPESLPDDGADIVNDHFN
jgi:hypothetical protein